MVLEKTIFERLFPASPSGMGLHSRTTFGFEASGKRHFVVTVPGRPRLEQGMAVIALLEKPSEWGSDSLLGWVDCAEGSLVCDSHAKLFTIALLSAFFAIMFPMRTYAVISSTAVADSVALLIAAVFGGFACRFLYCSAKALLVRRALEKVRAISRAASSF
jgi:hypothetical protein